MLHQIRPLFVLYISLNLCAYCILAFLSGKNKEDVYYLFILFCSCPPGRGMSQIL